MDNKLIFIPVGVATTALLYSVWYMNPSVENISNQLTKSGNWGNRSLSGITDITIHHAASSKTATPEDFARHHVNNKNWPGIGYHFVILQDGTIYQTNPIDALSYHNGYNNTKAIGVCLVGNFNDYPVPNVQQFQAIRLSKYLKRKIKSIKYLYGHKEYPGASTSCPGSNLNEDYYRKKSGLKKRVFNSQAIASKSIKYDSSEADN